MAEDKGLSNILRNLYDNIVTIKKVLILKKLFGIIIIMIIGYFGYIYIEGGYYKRPELPKNSFSISFKNGFRAIMVNMTDERLERNYIGVPSLDVPFWAKDAWSYCKRPTKKEKRKILKKINLGVGSRLEAICKIKVDKDTIINRGVVFSVPAL